MRKISDVCLPVFITLAMLAAFEFLNSQWSLPVEAAYVASLHVDGQSQFSGTTDISDYGWDTGTVINAHNMTVRRTGPVGCSGRILEQGETITCGTTGRSGKIDFGPNLYFNSRIRMLVKSDGYTQFQGDTGALAAGKMRDSSGRTLPGGSSMVAKDNEGVTRAVCRVSTDNYGNGQFYLGTIIHPTNTDRAGPAIQIKNTGDVAFTLPLHSSPPAPHEFDEGHANGLGTEFPKPDLDSVRAVLGLPAITGN